MRRRPRFVAWLCAVVVGLGMPMVLIVSPALAVTYQAHRTTYTGGGAQPAGYDEVRCNAATQAEPLVATTVVDFKCRLSWYFSSTPIPKWSPGVAGWAMCDWSPYYAQDSTTNTMSNWGAISTSGISSASACTGTNSSGASFQYVGGPSKSYTTINGATAKTCTGGFLTSAEHNGDFEVRCTGGTGAPSGTDTRQTLGVRILLGYYDSSGTYATTGFSAPLTATIAYSHQRTSVGAPWSGDTDQNKWSIDSTPTAAWPNPYPLGSSAYATGADCDANTFQDKDGGWWVTLAAQRRGDLYPGAVSQKAWTATWDAEDGLVGQTLHSDSSNRLTVPLPAINSRPDWGWIATFHERVKFPTGITGTTPANTTGDTSDGNWVTDVDGAQHWVPPLFAAAAGSWLAKNVGSEYVIEGAWMTGPEAIPALATPAGVAVASTIAFTASFSGTYWALDHFLGSSDDGAVSLGPRAKGFSPSGVDFYTGGTTPVAAAATYDEYEVACSVVVAPDNPPRDTLGTGTTDPPSGGSNDSGGSSGDNCQSGIKIPVLGWIADGMAQLACGIAHAFDGLLSLLKWLLIPDELDFSPITDAIDGAFPLNILSGMTEVATSVVGSLTTAVSDGDPCEAAIPVGDVYTSAMGAVGYGDEAAPMEGVGYRMPTPTSAGCAAVGGDEDLASLGNLFGFADDLREAQVWILYFGLAVAVFRAATHENEDELLAL